MFKRFSYFLLVSFFILSASIGHAGNASSSLKNLFTGESTEDEFLSPDAAFGVSIKQDGQNVRTNFTVAPNYYLYKTRTKFEFTPAQTFDVDLPKADIKNDPNFGQMEVYHQDFSANLRIKEQINAPINLKISYQGCSEKGLCYAPQHKSFTITPAGASSASDATSTPALASDDASVSDSQAANLLKSGKWWLIILGFFTAGLLLAFTPCVFPMIPILSSIIIGKNAHVSRLHAFNLSLAYTLGMCLTYTLAGIAAGLSGQMLSSALQTPWALGFGALIFVLLALSMFGFYELKLPSGMENGLMNLSRRIKGGRFFSDFLMGVLSALIISPCVAAPLAGALLYISKTNDVVLGGVALFSLSVGMGTPLLLIGASAGTLLPKVGSWMNAVRNLFGVLMLGVAIWLISPVIPMQVQLALWAAILIVPAIFMHALDSLPTGAKAALKFWKGIGVMMVVTGLALLIGALSNAKSPLQPLSGLVASSAKVQPHNNLNFQQIKSIADLENALKQAGGKPVMLDFYADWCVACKELEQFTFSDARVQSALKDTVLLQADVTNNTEDDKALMQKFNVFGPPGIVFFDAHAKEESQLKVVGYKDADTFLQILNQRGSCLPETIAC
nr:protein-disulfide reductase DsbD [uncultured Methylotenera sp.]